MKRNRSRMTHVDSRNRPSMVDVGAKGTTHRTARARAVVALPAAVLEAMKDGDLPSRKGPVFQTAIVAGIMAAKKTSELIPLCHPIAVDNCRIDISLNGKREAIIDCVVEARQKTGVEMEALTAASVAALTIYDMCKGLSHEIVVKEIRLLEKKGGKSDYRAS